MSTPSTDPRAHAVPVTPREVIASYTEYADAQAAVDTLSDKEFPVASTQIVGHDVRTVETVTGRVTNGSAAVRGAAGGAWFGLMLGLLFGIFTPGVAWLGVLLVAVGIGALWGATSWIVARPAGPSPEPEPEPEPEPRPPAPAPLSRAGPATPPAPG
nr:general stress protein [Clavibacter michiganensis]